MAITVPEGLLALVKNWLDITWTDTDADAKLTGQIQRGISYISAKTGVPADAFYGDSANYRAQELLLNYVLYDRSGSADEFKKKYQSDILGLYNLWEVGRHASSAEG